MNPGTAPAVTADTRTPAEVHAADLAARIRAAREADQARFNETGLPAYTTRGL